MKSAKTSPSPRLRSPSLSEAVMNDLCARIRHGLFMPGERLPTEPLLMAEQGVSRTVVREAISRLQAAGLVETRHGIGTFVLPQPVAAESAVDFMNVVTLRDVLAMLELRISLETEAAGLAAQRRSEAQLLAMRQTFATIEAGIQSGENTADADFEFHLQIVQATGNQYFEDFFRHLGHTTIPRARLDTARLSPDTGGNYLKQTNREHEYILDAMTRKDAAGARAGMRMHLTNSRERLRHACDQADRKAAANLAIDSGSQANSTRISPV